MRDLSSWVLLKTCSHKMTPNPFLMLLAFNYHQVVVLKSEATHLHVVHSQWCQRVMTSDLEREHSLNTA